MAKNYTIENCDLIKNHHGYTFQKLVKNGSCQFDEFVCEATRVIANKKKIVNLISRMEYFGDYPMPAGYIKQIKAIGYNDVYEFRKDDIRIYVKIVRPDVIIILGGYKNTQKKDIQQIKRILEQL